MIKKIIAFSFILSLCVAVFFGKYSKIEIKKIGNVKVIDSEKKVFFVFEDFFHPEFKKLKKNEGLEKIVGSGKTEFEKILALRNWVHCQWEQSVPSQYPPFNANIILEQIRSRKTGGWCAQYGVVFAQACMSLGIPARYLEISPPYEGGHFVTEVYSKDYKKWILVDATTNLYYEKNGIPLNVLELHKAGFHAKNEVYAVTISSKSISSTDYFYLCILWMRNNHLSSPFKVLNKKISQNISMFNLILDNRMWYDDNCVPASKRKEIISTVQFETVSINDFYWEPDIVVIKVLKKNRIKKTIVLEFSGLLKNYQKFFVSDDGRKTWHETASKYEWKMKKGSNMLEVTAPDITGLNKRFSYITAELGS